MFEFVRRLINMIFKHVDLHRAFGAASASSPEMDSAIEAWCTLYAEQGKGRLNLPSAISGELARLMLIEFKSELSGSARAEYLNGVYSGFLRDLRRKVEQGLAKGGLIFKPYFDGKGIAIDCIPPDCFTPTAFDSGGNITGAVFAQRIVKGREYYTRLEYHNLKNGNYTVENKAFKGYSETGSGTSVPLDSVPEWAGLSERTVIANVGVPLFAYFRVPIGNTVDPSSPLGVSVYNRAIKLIKDAEAQYEGILWEFKSGRRKVFVDRAALMGDKVVDDVFSTLDVEDANFFKEWSPEFRSEAMQKGLNSILQRIEFNCGLAYGTLSDPQNVDKTAEEIRASKQRSYAQVCDLQNALEAALRALVVAIDILATLYKLAPQGKTDISFEFDDSIVADRQAEYQEKLQLVQAGILQPWELRAWYLGETEAQAKEMTGYGGDD